MVKLYRKTPDYFFYAECWVSGGTAVTHWGVVGNSGKTKTAPCPDADGPQYEADFAAKHRKQGYTPLEEMPQYTVVLQLKIKDIDSAARTKDALIDALNHNLGWAGLGHVDGYDIDAKKRLLHSSYLRIFCVVVDENAAKTLIKSAADRLGLTGYSILSQP